jgi:cytochrome c553
VKIPAIFAIFSVMACATDPSTATSDGGTDVARLPVEVRNIMRESATTTQSHNLGTNCAACHSAEGNAMGFFTSSGSVRTLTDQPMANAAVEIRTAPSGGGELLARMVSDANGNFYTTRSLPTPNSPVFVSLLSPTGQRRNMPFPTLSAQCNFCHVGRQRFRM